MENMSESPSLFWIWKAEVKSMLLMIGAAPCKV